VDVPAAQKSTAAGWIGRRASEGVMLHGLLAGEIGA
jgi:hypothetical protein